MRQYKKLFPKCAWCGDLESQKHVHHIKPIKYYPELAGDPKNFCTLCGKGCHLYVGHGGNWHHYIDNIKEITKINRLEVRKIYEPIR